MSTTAYAWAPITKVEERDDGTVMVYGPAADAGVDRDKQRLNQEWLDSAMPQWMAEGGNVRGQHDPKQAIGVAAGLVRASSGEHNLAAHVVDPVAVKKVQTKVFKGFSVGIKDPQISFGKADAPNGEVIGGSIIEVSLVDRPSNPRTLFTMVKADAAGDLEDVEEPEVEDLGEDQATPEIEETDDGFTVKVDLKMPTGREIYEQVQAYVQKFISASSRRDSGVAADEVKTQAAAVLAELPALLPDLDKADTAGDVATAQQAIALIGKLVASEAKSLAAGQLSDECDIRCLLDAVAALKYFISCETNETETPMVDMPKADEVKPEDTPELVKVDSAGVADMVKAAVAEANQALKGELDLVKAELAKVAAMPVPGGPVAMRTASQTQAARGSDAATMRAQAADLFAKAEAIRRDDPTAAQGYRDRAAALLDKADA